MEKIIIDNNSSNFNESSSTFSDKREKEKKKNDSQYTNLYTALIESLSNDKSDTDKIKALILLEQDLMIIKDKNRLFHLFRIFENYLNDTDCLNSNILKGQILMTTTTILILLNGKEDYPQIFMNFVDNILIEHIKNTNNYSNIYLRQVSCQCLEELENEYPGLLFSLMGRKTLDILELQDYLKDDEKSMFSRSKKSFRSGLSEMPVIDNKKIEIENFGLYYLIEKEVFYVFQNYLSLYTTIFKHLIAYYFFEKLLKQNLINEEIDSPNSNNNLTQNQANDSPELNDFNLENLDDILVGKSSIKNTNTSIFNTSLMNIINNIPYLKHTFGNSNSFTQKHSSNNLNKEQKRGSVHLNNNFSSFFQGNSDKKYDKMLHINGSAVGLKYHYIFEKINSEDADMITSEGIKINQVFLSYINKALSLIVDLLPKTGEMMQTKICKSLKFIISRIEINHNSLLPFFSCFHLNFNSAILTLTAIKIVENFKASLKENFLLKLVMKLCLLINDLRINKALRILAIRWLLNFRFSNYNFDFNKHMTIFSYYLCPFPFDNVSVCIEKLKTLYLFYETISERESELIIRSILIMDNYKYFPIFSNYVKSLFKAYFFIIFRFPYKKFIKKLCELLRNNLKEVPRILPNMINLLRIIKHLGLMNRKSTDLRIREEDEELFHKMSFYEIHKYLLIKFSKFIARFNSPTKLNRYFELFIEIAKENSIQPQNLITGLRNLHTSIQEMRNWKIEKNILEVCKYLLKHHDLEIMKQNKIDDLLYDIHQKSFDYGIRDKAKLYYKLVTNVEKPILSTFLETREKGDIFTNSSININNVNISYDYTDFQEHLQALIQLNQSKMERFKAKVEDGGSAIFDINFKSNVMLLSDCSSQMKYSNFIYNYPIDNDSISAEKLNDLDSTDEINKIIDKIITPSDILRLYVNDEMIDDSNDAQIDPKKIFEFDREFTFSEGKEETELCLKSFLDDYFLMINKNKFYIKLPLDIYMQRLGKNVQEIPFHLKFRLEKIKNIYSINLCFGKMSHLDIKGPILLPYLEIPIEDAIPQLKFPYFYKIYLIVYPTYPIPSDVDVRAIFYDSKGVCCTGLLNSIKINFEDFFLPISVPPHYKTIYHTPEGRIQLRAALFKKLWKHFKINDTNFKDFVNTCRMMDFEKDKMISLVFARLGPFFIDENFLKVDYIVNNPYQGDSTDNEFPDMGNVRIKDYYNSQTGQFKTISYDFIMDEFIEKNSEKSYFAKNDVLRPSKYHLAEVIIFVPEKFHILLKIKISEFSSIIEVRSDCLKIIEYLDEYFDTWI